MKILLINNNPVVSRLTALSARKEYVALDEIKNISELKANDYDIIFVDGESYNNDVSNIIRNSGVEKRVLFYSQGEDKNQSIFTQTILKPFLPSEVSEILRETKVTILKNKEDEKQKEEQESVNFKDLVKESKDKELEVLNIMEKKEPAVALAAVAAVTSTLVTDKPVKEEPVEKDAFDLKIEEAFPLSLDDNKESSTKEEKSVENAVDNKKEMFDLDADLFELDDKKKLNPTESNLFELDDKKETLKEGFDDTLFEIDKEIKKDILDDSPLDFDTESKNEVSFSPKVEKIEVKKIEVEKIEKPETKEPKIEEISKITEKPEITTKVLNNDDISSIKDILDEKKGSENLTEVPASLMRVQEVLSTPEPLVKKESIVEVEEIVKTENIVKIEEVKEQEIPVQIASLELGNHKEISKEQPSKRKKKKKKKYSDEMSTGSAIAHTLSKLPVKDLRLLLRGAKVNVSIEFPNEV